MSEIPPPPKGFETRAAPAEAAAPAADIPPPPAGFTSRVTGTVGADGIERTPEGRAIVRITKKTYPDAGVGDALTRGVAQGATAGFADEMQAMSEAGGATNDYNGIQHLLGGFIRYLAQDPEAHAKYNEAVDREREALKGAEENHPYVTGAGKVGGVLATIPAGGGASGATTVAARALAAAKQGAVFGGLSGAGEGEGLADKAIKAAGGTVIGGVVGGVAAPLLEGAGTVVKAVGRRIGNTIRAVRDPETEAARQYLTTLAMDREADPRAISRMTPAEFNASPDAMMVDYGGDAVKRLADVASITSPKAQTILKHEIDQRFENQSGRFSDWFRSNFHYPDAYQQGQALDQVAKSVNRPAYAKAYAEGDRPIMSPVLEQLMGSPKVVEAMKAASTSGKDRAVTEGFGAFNPGVSVENGLVTFRKGPSGVPTFPNLQFWDQTRRELSQAAKKAERAGANEDASVYGNLAKQMNAELDRAVPSYQTARQGAAGFFGADNALEAGQAFARSDKIGISEARDQLAKMKPVERRLFTDGFVSDFIDMINKVGDRRDVLQKIGRSPQARAKLELVMGPEKFRELEAKLRVEGIFDDVRKAVQGNSWTARRLYDAGMLGGGSLGADGTYNMDPKEMALGAFTAALASKGKSVNMNVATKLAEMLVSKDPAVVQKGFKAISGDSRLMEALRAADTKIGRITSLAAPTKPVLQLTGAVSADDQPGVERPVGR